MNEQEIINKIDLLQQELTKQSKTEKPLQSLKTITDSKDNSSNSSS